MNAGETKYSPPVEVVQELATKPISTRPVLPAREPIEITGYEPSERNPQKIYIAEENKQIAIGHIRETLGHLQNALRDITVLAPASQKAIWYQQMAFVAKQLIEGSQILFELDPEEKSERKVPVNQHLHMSLTGSQLNDLIQKQKKAKDA